MPEANLFKMFQVQKIGEKLLHLFTFHYIFFGNYDDENEEEY